MDHEELRFEAVGELDRASITPQRAILLGIAHLLSQEVAEVLLALAPHPMESTDADPGHRRPPEVGLLRACDERHEAAVAPAEDDEPLGIDVRHGAERSRARGGVLATHPA